MAPYFSREKISFLNVSDKTGQFKILKKNFTQQFSQIYFARLQALRPIILKRIASLNGKLEIPYWLNAFFVESLPINRVLDVEESQESYIVGTVFCENINRPNVFEEVEKDQVEHYLNIFAYKFIDIKLYNRQKYKISQ